MNGSNNYCFTEINNIYLSHFKTVNKNNNKYQMFSKHKLNKLTIIIIMIIAILSESRYATNNCHNNKEMKQIKQK